MVEETQKLFNAIKEKLDPDGRYEDIIKVIIRALYEYLCKPETHTHLPPEEIATRIVQEGLPPFAKIGGAAVEGTIAGTVVGGVSHGIFSSFFVQAGFFTGIKAALGLTSGIIVSSATYTALVIAAPIGMAVAAGAGIFWGANTLRNDGEKRKLSKFSSEVLMASLPIVWVDGELSQEEKDTLEKLIQSAAINQKDMTRVRQAMQSPQTFDQVLQSGFLREENTRKEQIKRRLIICTAYELAKAEGSISTEALDLHNRMAKIMNIEESEVQEMRRLLLLQSGIGMHDRITVVQGDITQESVDAIVNSTNPDLHPRRKFGPINLPKSRNRIDAVIHQVAGPELQVACQELAGCEVGEAKLTSGYNLPTSQVIHTVAPVWKGSEVQAKELLGQCYRNSLSIAFENSIETLAFPALGTGTGKIPVEQAAAIAIQAVREFLDLHFSIKQVRFVCNDAKVYHQFKLELTNQIGDLPACEAFSADALNEPLQYYDIQCQPA